MAESKPPVNPNMQYGSKPIKNFSKHLLNFYQCSNPGQQPRSELGIWPRRFWEHKIDNEAGLANHIVYIYYNPVKHHCIS